MELIKVYNHHNNEIVSARELHTYLNNKRQFADWIKQRIEQYGFTEGQDYTTFHKIVNRSRLTEYAITIDMAKELCMVENNEEGRTARRYFIERDNKLRKLSTALPDFENPVEMARAWADQMEQRQLAEAKIKSMEPKASYAERVLEKDNQLVDIGQAAKLLKLPFGRNTLFRRLREEGVFFKSRNEPLQQYLNYFQLRKKEVMMGTELKMVTKVYVNAKGLYWLSKRYDGSLEEFENLKVE